MVVNHIYPVWLMPAKNTARLLHAPVSDNAKWAFRHTLRDEINSQSSFLNHQGDTPFTSFSTAVSDMD